MNGICFINERYNLNGLPSLESTELQKKSLLTYIKEQKIKVTILNPYQLNDYYTIPHALYYDLKKRKTQLDCLIMYSPNMIEEYIKTYPARWLMLKSYFKEIIMIE